MEEWVENKYERYAEHYPTHKIRKRRPDGEILICHPYILTQKRLSLLADICNAKTP